MSKKRTTPTPAPAPAPTQTVRARRIPVARVVIHCTATRQGMNVTAEDVIRWHTTPIAQGGRGWSRAGYRHLILLDGTLETLVPFDDDGFIDPWERSNGAAGFNEDAIHVCYVGGLNMRGEPTSTMTAAQETALVEYLKDLVRKHPRIKIQGHYQLNASKACPSFNVPKWALAKGFSPNNL